MRIYTHQTLKTSKRRAQFARQMMLEEFGHRYGRAVDQGDHVDRLPHQHPPTIYEVGGRK